MDKLDNIQFDDHSIRKLTSSIICGNNDKIKKHSGITELVNLKTGLIKTINYYKNERSSNVN